MGSRKYTVEKRIEKFWQYIDVRGPEECWPWQRSKISSGYGAFWKDGTYISAHVMAWELANGVQVPDGLQVQHGCNNRICTNPAHLTVGTPKANTAYAARLFRMAQAERHHNHKLTVEGVKEILSLFADGCSQKDLASQFGVSAPAIHMVVRGRTWKSVSR